jgi:hypothetical protein
MSPSLSTRPQRLSTGFSVLQQAYDLFAQFLDTATLLV